MRTMKTVLLAIVICLLASGCGSLFTASQKDTVSHIRPGMSKEQVEGMLGSPDYTRFDGGIEQWEYGSFYYVDSHSVNVIIDFDNGRVIALNTFNTPPVAPVPPVPPVVAVPSTVHAEQHFMLSNEKQFEKFYHCMKEEPFTSGRLNMLEKEVRHTDFTCEQCIRLMNLNTFDDDKLKMLRLLAPVLSDPENSSEILDSLDFLSSKDKAKKILQEHK